MTTQTEESQLITHARRELQLAGLFDEDSDYGGMLGTSVMKLVEAFANEGHSGFSAAMAIDIFQRLARFQNLTPLTTDPDEWMNVSDMSGSEMWQSRRRSDAFSTDGGKTHYLLDDKPRKIYVTATHVK